MKIRKHLKLLWFCFAFNLMPATEAAANTFSFYDKAGMISPSLLLFSMGAQLLWKRRTGSGQMNQAVKEVGGRKHRSSGSRAAPAQPQGRTRPKTRSFSCCCLFNRQSDDDDDEPHRRKHSREKTLTQCQATAINVDPDHEDEDDEARQPGFAADTPASGHPPQIQEVEVEVHQIDTAPEPTATATEVTWLPIAEGVYVTQNLVEGSDISEHQVYVTDEHIPANLVINGDNQDLICTLCCNLMCNPQDCCEEGHHYCQHCISSLASEDCPGCRRPLQQPSRTNRGVQRRILDIKVVCPYCQQQQVLSNIAGHIGHCESRPDCCTFCRQPVKYDELCRHIKDCSVRHINQTPQFSREQLLSAVQQLTFAMMMAFYIPHPQPGEIDQTLYLSDLQLRLISIPGFPGVFQELGVASPLALYFLVDSDSLDNHGRLCNFSTRYSINKPKLHLGKVCSISKFSLRDKRRQDYYNCLSFSCGLSGIDRSGTYKARLELLSMSGEQLASHTWILTPDSNGDMNLSSYSAYSVESLSRAFIDSYLRATGRGLHQFLFRFSVIAPGH